MYEVVLSGWRLCLRCQTRFRRESGYETDKPYPGHRYGTLCAACLRYIVEVEAPEAARRREHEAARRAFLRALGSDAA